MGIRIWLKRNIELQKITKKKKRNDKSFQILTKPSFHKVNLISSPTTIADCHPDGKEETCRGFCFFIINRGAIEFWLCEGEK